MNQDPKPEKLNDPDPAEGQPEHPEYHRGRRHEAIERDSELAALRAERDALRLQLGRTGKELTLASDRAERAESDAAESKRRCGDARDQINIALAQFLSGVIARYRQGETIMCASEAESWMEANFDPLSSAAALTPEASK